MKHCTVCKGKYDDGVSFCPVDGEVLEDDPSSIVGTVLDGQYQIDAMLGKGGMGAVYRARHILLGDRVAIKILPPEVRNNAEWLRRFRREGQAARRFRHPNSVTVYDLRTASDGVIYMVMEYVEGHTLDAEIRKRGRLSHTEAFQLLEPIMSVLNTAHAMGVVHRDLKPENIMIGKAGTNGEQVVKLLDLGIAKMSELADSDTGGGTALTVAGQVLGTPYYMSPEQWGEIPKDGSSEIDGRADIYSLGLVFYEMITGKRPYLGKTLQELRREHIQTEPPPLHEVVTDVPRGFSEAIKRATAKDRGERQTTAGELALQLRENLGPAKSYEAPASESQQLARTMEISSARGTNSDVDSPTILTVDTPEGVGRSTPPPTPVVEGPLPKAPHFDASLPLPQPSPVPSQTVIEKSDSASILTIPSPIPSREAPRSRSGSAIFVGLGVLVVILLVVGVGGFAAYKWINNKSSTTGAGTTSSSNSASNSSGTVVGSPVEVGRYWLEIEPRPGAKTLRVGGNEALTSGQSLKLHLGFDDNGYTYIVGPGDGNQPTAFLTAQPPKESGLESNQVSKGMELSFPSGSGNWLTLDKNPGTDKYTVVFSPSKEAVPGFLNAEFTGKPLSSSEQQQLTEFLSKYTSNKAVTEVNTRDEANPFVAVKAPGGLSGNPIIFEIRIQHK
jgi:eukaryotic-like serine/threonine-protein kinase